MHMCIPLIVLLVTMQTVVRLDKQLSIIALWLGTTLINNMPDSYFHFHPCTHTLTHTHTHTHTHTQREREREQDPFSSSYGHQDTAEDFGTQDGLFSGSGALFDDIQEEGEGQGEGRGAMEDSSKHTDFEVSIKSTRSGELLKDSVSLLMFTLKRTAVVDFEFLSKEITN